MKLQDWNAQFSAPARHAFRRIADLPAQFTNREPRLPVDKPAAAPLALRNIESRGASYTFATVTDVAPFKLGSVDLSIDRGETLFIVGEDGCGKTGLIKLLL